VSSERPVVVEVPWRELSTLFSAVASVLFSLVLIYIAISNGQFRGIFRVVMAAGAGLFLYSAATVALNKSRLELDDSDLRVTHGPLPWRSGQQIRRSQIARIRANPQSRRLELRTKIGEELILLTALSPAAVEQLNEAFGSSFDD
jgi:hypothetical protein